MCTSLRIAQNPNLVAGSDPKIFDNSRLDADVCRTMARVSKCGTCLVHLLIWTHAASSYLGFSIQFLARATLVNLFYESYEWPNR